MYRRPPKLTRTDTLFPYTTLFRSECGDDTRRVGADLALIAGGSPDDPIMWGRRRREIEWLFAIFEEVPEAAAIVGTQPLHKIVNVVLGNEKELRAEQFGKKDAAAGLGNQGSDRCRGSGVDSISCEHGKSPSEIGDARMRHSKTDRSTAVLPLPFFPPGM